VPSLLFLLNQLYSQRSTMWVLRLSNKCKGEATRLC